MANETLPVMGTETGAAWWAIAQRLYDAVNDDRRHGNRGDAKGQAFLDGIGAALQVVALAQGLQLDGIGRPGDVEQDRFRAWTLYETHRVPCLCSPSRDNALTGWRPDVQVLPAAQQQRLPEPAQGVTLPRSAGRVKVRR